MKQTLLIAALLFTSYLSKAQIEITKPIEEFAANKNTVVTNEKGVKFSYAGWSKLMATGNYKLNPLIHDSDSTSFILVRRNEKAEDAKFAKLPKPVETKFFKTGSVFRFKDMIDMNGEQITAESLKGKIVVLNFWFIACPPCRYEMPELNTLVENYKNNKDVIFIAISLDKLADVKKFLTIIPFKYHVVGQSMSLFYLYGVDECPASLVIDKTGIIKFHSQGYGDGATPYWIKKTIAEIQTQN
jgi:thiol-disulfide isomerase/thioredoxin